MDLVVLELGTDDMHVASVTDFEMAFGALVASIQADSPNADLVCAGTWSATGGLYDAIIQRDCTAAKGRYVSLQALYDTPAYHGPAGGRLLRSPTGSPRTTPDTGRSRRPCSEHRAQAALGRLSRIRWFTGRLQSIPAFDTSCPRVLISYPLS